MRGFGDIALPAPITPDIQPVPGITTDETGMPVVTIVASQPSIPWWVWVLGAGALLYFGSRK